MLSTREFSCPRPAGRLVLRAVFDGAPRRRPALRPSAAVNTAFMARIVAAARSSLRLLN